MADIKVGVALASVPVNIVPLVDSDNVIVTSIVYNSAGMALKWNFLTVAGTMTQTAVTPTTSGDYDWAHKGGGMYSLEIPASGGAWANNDTVGTGWFSGVADGVLPFRGPELNILPAAVADIRSGASSIGTAQTGDSYAALTAVTVEPTAPPASTASIIAFIRWMGTWYRNKLTNDGTDQKLYANDNSTVIGTSGVSDVTGTTTRGKVS